ILNGEMSEWFKEHAWKSDRFTRADAHQILPTHVGSISSRYNELLRDAPVNDDVHRGFRGVCDTVLTQSRSQLVSRRTDVHSSRTEVRRDILHRAPLRLAFHIKTSTDSRRPRSSNGRRTHRPAGFRIGRVSTASSSAIRRR